MTGDADAQSAIRVFTSPGTPISVANRGFCLKNLSISIKYNDNASIAIVTSVN